MELSAFNIKKFLIFSQKKDFLILKIIYISGNGTFLYFRKLLIFQDVIFQAQKIKKIHTLKRFQVLGNGTF